MKKKLLLLVVAATALPTQSISLVYNLKIRRSFSISSFLHATSRKRFWLLTALPIVYARTRHIVDPFFNQDVYEKGLIGGAIFNIRYIDSHNWWAEFTTGLENQTSKYFGTSHFKASRTGFDDIILSAGKNFRFQNNRGEVDLYALAGFPARTKVTLKEKDDPLVGTRFFGLGAGAEASYAFLHTLKRELTGIVQARFVHFLNRKWYPILPCNARIQPGNLTDVFLIAHYREKKHILEFGYNATFFTNDAVILATGKVPGPNTLRNSFYSNYAYLMEKTLLLKKPGVLGTGLNIGRAKTFSTKIIAWWVNLSVLF